MAGLACVAAVVLVQVVTIVTALTFWKEARTRDTVLSDPTPKGLGHGRIPGIVEVDEGHEVIL